MFDYGPEWAKMNAARWLIEDGEAKWIGGTALLIGQFGLYEASSGDYNTQQVMGETEILHPFHTEYAIGLQEIEDCLTTYGSGRRCLRPNRI